LDWLDFVKTSQAKNKIKQWFRKQVSSENLQRGKRKLEKALIVAGYSPKEELTAAHFDRFKAHFTIDKYDDLFLQIAHGDVRAREVVQIVAQSKTSEKDAEKPVISTPKPPKRKSDDLGIRVLGEENISVRLAKCCNPLPGDEITGFVSLGSGISVHRKDCRHLRYGLDDTNRSRLIEVAWDSTKHHSYPVTLQVDGFDRPRILQDILQKISDHHASLRKVDTTLTPEGGGVTSTIVFDVPNLSELKRLMTAINGVPDVLSVRRIHHD
jgi:GTP pyrophosphokinase